LRARISFDRLACSQTCPPKNSLKNPGFSELPTINHWNRIAERSDPTRKRKRQIEGFVGL
jgi:hypothetical protein